MTFMTICIARELSTIEPLTHEARWCPVARSPDSDMLVVTLPRSLPIPRNDVSVANLPRNSFNINGLRKGLKIVTPIVTTYWIDFVPHVITIVIGVICRI